MRNRLFLTTLVLLFVAILLLTGRATTFAEADSVQFRRPRPSPALGSRGRWRRHSSFIILHSAFCHKGVNYRHEHSISIRLC